METKKIVFKLGSTVLRMQFYTKLHVAGANCKTIHIFNNELDRLRSA